MPNECNLECIKLAKQGGGEMGKRMEFVGPVKIVLFDNTQTSGYIRLVWYAAVLNLAEMLLATATSIAQFFSMEYKKASFLKGIHALCGIIGLQSCLLSGLLVMNSVSGPAAPVTVPSRKTEHVCAEIAALLCCGVCIGSVYMDGFKPLTLHSVLGLGAVGLMIVTVLSGLLVSKWCCPSADADERFGFCMYMHLITAIPTCIVASMCFVSALSYEVYMRWLNVHDMYNYIILCCCFYTTIITYKPLSMIFSGKREAVSDY